MSQQTQIERVATYWRRWIDRWPDAVSLSNATQEEVNEMWAGLGYYPQGTVSFYLWLYLSFFFIFTRAISMTSCFVHLFTGICWTEPNTLLPTAACPLT